MNVFASLYAILAVLVSSFLLDNYQKIENFALAGLAELDIFQLVNVWIYLILGIVYLNIVYVLYQTMIRKKKNRAVDKAKLERV